MSEAPITDLQPLIDEKVAALNARLTLIEEQNAAELARFPAVPAPEPPKHVRRVEDDEPAPKGKK